MLGDISTAIDSISFTNNDQIAVVTYENGLISAYDVRGGFTWLGDIEKEVQRIGNLSLNGNLSKMLERREL